MTEENLKHLIGFISGFKTIDALTKDLIIDEIIQIVEEENNAYTISNTIL